MLVAILVAFTILLSGCSQEQVKPTATVDDVSVKDISLQNLDLEVRVIVNNPNPVGAHLTKVAYDIYYLKDGESNYLGHGEKKDIDIRKQGDTTITIPTTIDNKEAIKTIIELARKGAVTLKVDGSAYLDLKATSFEIPFERTKEVTIPEHKLPELSEESISEREISTPNVRETVREEVEEKLSTPTPTATEIPTTTEETPTPTPTPTETPMQSLYIRIKPKPAQAGKVVTIEITDASENPVSDVRVGYVTASSLASGHPIPRYIGETNENGEVTHTFRHADEYFIGAVEEMKKHIGNLREEYNNLPAVEYLRVKSRLRDSGDGII